MFGCQRRPRGRGSNAPRNLSSVKVSVAKPRKPNDSLSRIKSFSSSSAVTTSQSISWTDYCPIPVKKIGVDREWRTSFHGILNYIMFKSGQMYNTSEILLEYSSMQPTSDVAHLLNCQTPECYETGSGAGHSLTFTFHQIRVRPTAYVFRYGDKTSTQRLITSLIFQGWDSGRQQWTVLDERHMDLESPSRIVVGSVDTAKDFHKFRIIDTSSGYFGARWLAINAFEIHGAVIAPGEEQLATGDDGDGEFDPWKFAECE
jgi:hypothetical protein